MLHYRIVAIPTAVAETVRATGRAPRYGHPAHTELATGHGPCRHCLRTFDIGAEHRLLFTYDAFDGHEPLPLPGPVFIHAEPCMRYPEDGGFPAMLRDLPLTLNAYARGRVLVAREHVSAAAIDPAIERLLGRPDVDYIHVRNREAGCFGFRIERAG